MGQAYQAANIAQGRMMGVLVPTGPASTIGTPPVRDVRLTTFPEPMTARWSIKDSRLNKLVMYADL